MKKILALIGTIVLLVIAGISIKTYIDDKNIVENILNEKVVFQYGDDVKIEDEDYIFNYDITPLLDENNYVKVGEYELDVSFDYKSKEIQKLVTLVVQDTIGPKFTQFKDQYEVFENEKLKDIEKDFKATDLSKVSLAFDLDKVKFDKKGEYNAKVIATDAHQNSTTKTFSVIVKEKPAPPKPKPTPPTTPAPQSPTNFPTVKDATYRGGHVIVNKKHGLPPNFASGENPDAVANLRNLIAEMKSLGMKVDGSWAGYRTYEHQEYLYTNYVRNHGQAAADISSAVPGFSEHQTGLAFDLRSPSGVLLQTEPEISWVRDNVHRFGFVIRYPEGKTHITGYKHEPWHLRYLGSDATKLYEANQTLEEYFNIEG